MTRQITNAPTEAEALAIHGGEPYNGSSQNAKDVVTPGGAVCNTLAPTRKGQKLPDQLMPNRLDLGSHAAFTVGQCIHQRKTGYEGDWAGRSVMGFRLPEWQREFVWDKAQCVKLIESLWLGIDIGTYTFNRLHDRPELDDLLIDGQQRMMAIQRYLDDEFSVFGYLWSEITDVDRRMFYARHFHCFITASSSEKYLRNYYNTMNFSGTAHKEHERA